MSSFITNRSINTAASQPRSTKSSGGFRSFFYAAKRHAQKRKMTRALEALDDRMLADVGLYRSSIPQFVAAHCATDARIKPLAHPAQRDDIKYDPYLMGA
ncbi:DUF1127 domain-containing protein [Sulfitobacter sp. F26169L]|uniref:DUF1127 domain-containing protein n=1 Tax=Sulfitobacter sp. F26169L TaxID=2996015 RepID=UPI00226090B1|nr:DUF1127 domain-containing protein [Sulfitobacter sp. F26169L]MCX7567382.1 DUF1127 domain-containing protein [Sulfitobacter sp. F26169L]